MNTRIKLKRGNSTQKPACEEIMNAGEPFLELDTNILYTATEDNTLVKNVAPINVSKYASLGDCGAVHQIFTIAPDTYGKKTVVKAQEACNCIWEQQGALCDLALCTDTLDNTLQIRPFEKFDDNTGNTIYEIIPKLIQITPANFNLQVESEASEQWSPISVPVPLKSGCYKIYWKASLGTGKATYGVSETYINCKSLDVDDGFIASEYSGSKLSVKPKNPQPDTDECEGLWFSATASTGTATVYFNIFKIYKVIE